MNQKKDTRKQKSYLTVGVITLVAVIALAGISYRKTSSREREEQEAVVMADAEWAETEVDETGESEEEDSIENGDVSGENTASREDAVDGGESDSPDEMSGSGAEASVDGKEEADSVEGEVQTGEETSVGMADLSFSGSDTLSWPLQGDVILNYSMDQSVYFATLDQYKYNPAMVIAGKVNDQVTAATAGLVVSVETSEETGETVTMDIGSGYQLIYGQLKEVQMAEGDYVSEGDLIGFLSEPTKYYSVEGCNLYFQMLKDGAPVNPLDYLSTNCTE